MAKIGTALMLLSLARFGTSGGVCPKNTRLFLNHWRTAKLHFNKTVQAMLRVEQEIAQDEFSFDDREVIVVITVKAEQSLLPTCTDTSRTVLVVQLEETTGVGNDFAGLHRQ